MALFYVSHPPWLRLVGVRTSYIHFSNISWIPQVLDPITNPFLGPSSWLHPASILKIFKMKLLETVNTPNKAHPSFNLDFQAAFVCYLPHSCCFPSFNTSHPRCYFTSGKEGTLLLFSTWCSCLLTVSPLWGLSWNSIPTKTFPPSGLGNMNPCRNSRSLNCVT